MGDSSALARFAATRVGLYRAAALDLVELWPVFGAQARPKATTRRRGSGTIGPRPNPSARTKESQGSKGKSCATVLWRPPGSVVIAERLRPVRPAALPVLTGRPAAAPRTAGR